MELLRLHHFSLVVEFVRHLLEIPQRFALNQPKKSAYSLQKATEKGRIEIIQSGQPTSTSLVAAKIVYER